MITTIVMGLVGILWIIGFIIMFVELKGSKLGYEDVTGFHYGKEPTNRL
jgi:hypothetical protein